MATAERKGGSTRRRRGRGEGSVFWSDSKGCWVGRVRVGVRPDGKPKLAEVTARTKAGALEKMRQKGTAAAPVGVGGGTSGGGEGKAAPTPPAASAYIRDYLDRVARPEVEPSSWASYDSLFRTHIEARLGDVRLDRLTPPALAALLAEVRAGGRAAATVQGVRNVLSMALNHAVATGLLPSSPLTAAVRAGRGGGGNGAATPPPVEPFTLTESRAILDLALANARGKPGWRYPTVFVLLLASGMRLSEALALAWRHVDWDAGRVRVERSLTTVTGRGFVLKETKTRAGRRTVELPGFALDALRLHRARMEAAGLADGGGGAGAGADAAVYRTASGLFVRRCSLRSHWANMLARLGLTFRKIHSLRHTHASQLLAAGVPITEVARRLGDRPATILKTYAHCMPGTSGVPLLLDRLLGGGGSGGGRDTASGGSGQGGVTVG